MSDKTALGDRMKGYERIPRIKLTPRMPIVVRVDGKAFHSYTRGFERPWDRRIVDAMTAGATALLDNIQGADIAYLQSDEISIVINTYRNFDTQPWFDNDVQKIASVSASIVTAAFNSKMREEDDLPIAARRFNANFDARCFAIPREEAVNYFIWRQRDAIRNSISGYAQSIYSHNDLHEKDTTDMKAMLLEVGLDWEALDPWKRHGWCVRRVPDVKMTPDGEVVRSKLEADMSPPSFGGDRTYIDYYLEQIEE